METEGELLLSKEEKAVDFDDPRQKATQMQTSTRSLYLLFICFIIAVPLAYVAGASGVQVVTIGPVPVGAAFHNWTLHHIYTQAPSNESNFAWESLYPTSRGVSFRHPTFAPNRGVFAMYHQLHCIDGLRHAYWEAHTAASSGSGTYNATTHHIEHCIDYLRQSITCHSDTNVEPYIDGKGYFAFGTHQCRSYEDVLKWLLKTQEEFGGFDHNPTLIGTA